MPHEYEEKTGTLLHTGFPASVWCITFTIEQPGPEPLDCQVILPAEFVLNGQVVTLFDLMKELIKDKKFNVKASMPKRNSYDNCRHIEFTEVK